MSTVIDPYATLGIPAGATHAEAARAHRRLAKRYHPDLNAGPAATERMRRINQAWRILSDPARRARYDAQLAPAPGAVPGTTTWTTWPDGRVASAPRTRRPPRPAQREPSIGDRPAVIVAMGLLLGLLYFVGAWLGSIAP